MSATITALQLAKDCFERSLHLPEPEGFSVGAWWKAKQEETRRRIAGFQTAEEAVCYAQTGSASGFDHRVFDSREALQIINFKRTSLNRLFPNAETILNLSESSYSDPSSLVQVDNKPVSSIFFSHLHYYLRASGLLGSRPNHRILEIGAGYGALARIFKMVEPSSTYVLVDLPESLFYAHVFLSLNFPSAKIDYLLDDSAFDHTTSDFILVPAQACGILSKQSFDMVINTGSFQEMPTATVTFWMKFIQETIRTRFFYSFNYFLVNKRVLNETSGEQSNLICPTLDPWWNIRHFEINPETLTVDADRRNWLEVAVERVSDRTFEPSQRGRQLFQQNESFPIASNEWFARTWMAIWCDPCAEYIEAILKGIDRFRGFTRASIPKNFYGIPAQTFKSKVKRLLRKIGFEKILKPDPTDFSEITYYRNRLTEIRRTSFH